MSGSSGKRNGWPNRLAGRTQCRLLCSYPLEAFLDSRQSTTLTFTMQDKHPLETIIENIIASLPTRGAIKANVKTDAIAALEKWREHAEPAQSTELTDLRALNAAVQKALKWAPPEVPAGAQVTKQYQPLPVPGEQPVGWTRAEAIAPGTGQTLQPAPLPPGVVRAQPVTRPSIAGQVAAAVAANITDGLPPGVVQAQWVQPIA